MAVEIAASYRRLGAGRNQQRRHDRRDTHEPALKVFHPCASPFPAGCPGLVLSPRNGFKARRGEKFYLCVVGFRTTHVEIQRVCENTLTILHLWD